MALTTTMNLVDQVSSKFNTMATSGAAAIEKINGSLAAANAMYVEYDVAAIEAGKATLEWTDKLGHYDEELMLATHSTEELIEEGYAVAIALDDVGDSAEGATHSVDGLGAAADDTGEAMEDAGEQSEEFGDKSQQAIGDLDQLLATAGIAASLKEIYEWFKQTTEAAEQLETAEAQLATIAGQENLSGLTPQIMDLSNATGIAATELNDVTYNAISAGTAVEESVNMAKTSTELATAGFTSSGAALSVLSTAMNSYEDQIESVTDVSDSLIMVQNLGVTTVDQLASNMGKAIATAAAYDVSLGNVESSYISITKAGINTAEATTYLSGMLNELGNSGSDISKILQEETGKSFGQLMAEGKSLADVLGIVYGSVNQNSEAMINLFGSQEAGKAAMAIINQGLDTFNANLQTVQNSAGATASAYAIMADTTEYAHNRMNNAALNTKAIIGDQLNASLKGLYNTGAAILEGVGSVLEKAPAVTAILTGAVIGVAALTVGVTAYTAVTKYGTMIQAAFNATMAANPLFWIVPVIIGVVSAAGILINVMKEADAEYESLTSASKAQYNELERMKSKYKEVADAQGEASEEAVRLATEIEVQESVFNSTKMTIDEWNSRMQESNQTHDDLIKKCNDLVIAQEYGADAVDTLVDRYNALTSKEELNQTEKTELGIIVDSLNGKMEGLGLTFDEVSGKTNKGAKEITDYYKAASQTQFVDEAKQKIIELNDELSSNKIQQAIAKNNLDAAKEAYDAALSAYENKNSSNWFVALVDSIGFANSAEVKAYEQAKEDYEKLQSDAEDYQEQIDVLSDKVTEASNASNTGVESVDTAVNNHMLTIEQLAAKYDEAYAAAEESFSGQFSLFDTAQADAEATVASAQSALDSQLSFWTTYADNVSQLKSISANDLGVTQETYDALMAYAQSGTEQAAGLAQSMVNSINSGNTEAVANLASTYAKVEEQQKNAAAQVADWQTDFSKKLADIQKDMNKTVDEMEKSQEAKTAAETTINTYINTIRGKVDEARSAAQAVANATAAALNNTSTTPGHAAGSTNTEDAFIAGEQGPELYVGYGGGTVFPHSETERVISAVKEFAGDYPEPPAEVSNMSVQSAVPVQQIESSERRISIDFNGNGNISFAGGVDKEQVLDIMIDNMRPVLLNILEEEITEEGDGTYEY